MRKIKGHVLFDVSTSSQSALLCRFFVPSWVSLLYRIAIVYFKVYFWIGCFVERNGGVWNWERGNKKSLELTWHFDMPWWVDT